MKIQVENHMIMNMKFILINSLIKMNNYKK